MSDIFAKISSLTDYQKFIDTFDKELINQHGKDYTSCWLYTYYVHTILNLPLKNNECVYSANVDINKSDDLNFDKNGIYSMNVSNNVEFHHFILIIDNNDLRLLSTYGGQQGLIGIEFNKSEWLRNFKQLFDSDINPDDKLALYCTIFSIAFYPHSSFDIQPVHIAYEFYPIDNK